MIAAFLCIAVLAMAVAGPWPFEISDDDLGQPYQASTLEYVVAAVWLLAMAILVGGVTVLARGWP